jgi:hypothetical protein
VEPLDAGPEVGTTPRRGANDATPFQPVADVDPDGWSVGSVNDGAGAHDDPVGTILPADGTPSGGAPSGSPAATGGHGAGHGSGTGPGGAGHGGATGASGTSDAAFAAFTLDALASLVLHAVDDELPSSPVFGTDTTPD